MKNELEFLEDLLIGAVNFSENTIEGYDKIKKRIKILEFQKEALSEDLDTEIRKEIDKDYPECRKAQLNAEDKK